MIVVLLEWVFLPIRMTIRKEKSKKKWPAEGGP
jgi:hypothetical protein